MTVPVSALDFLSKRKAGHQLHQLHLGFKAQRSQKSRQKSSVIFGTSSWQVLPLWSLPCSSENMFFFGNSINFYLHAACWAAHSRKGKLEEQKDPTRASVQPEEICAQINHTISLMSFVPWSQMVEPMNRFFFFHLPEPSWSQGGLSNIHLMLQELGSLQERAAQEKELERDAGTWGLFAGTFELSFHPSFCVEGKKHQQKLTIVTYDCLYTKQIGCGNQQSSQNLLRPGCRASFFSGGSRTLAK